MIPAYFSRPVLEGKDIFLRLLVQADANALLEVYSQEQDFLRPWEPARDSDFYTVVCMQNIIQALNEGSRDDEAYSFGIFLRNTRQLIGRITLSSVARGVSQSANLGYFLAQAYNGRGYMTEAVRLMLDFAFREIGLHRVQAGTMLQNYGSQRVLEKAGFRREGLALRYLKINGKWEDHYLFAITGEEF